MAYYAGLDIGGTKLAASVAKVEGGAVEILAKAKFPTPQGYPAALALLTKGLAQALEQAGLQRQQLAAAGISCGGPLNSRTGRILSPPNLPGWDDVPIVADLEKELGLPVALQNDADACALAEWRFGAGRGAQNMVFFNLRHRFGGGPYFKRPALYGQRQSGRRAGAHPLPAPHGIRPRRLRQSRIL